MALKKITKITNKQIAEKGVQALADRPNLTAQYGASGLSAAQLKLWFDKLATFLAERINEIVDTISSDEAANYIRVCLDEYGVESFGDLVTAFTDGDFAAKVLQVFPSAGSTQKQALQTVINNIAQKISDIKENGVLRGRGLQINCENVTIPDTNDTLVHVHNERNDNNGHLRNQVYIMASVGSETESSASGNPVIDSYVRFGMTQNAPETFWWKLSGAALVDETRTDGVALFQTDSSCMVFATSADDLNGGVDNGGMLLWDDMRDFSKDENGNWVGDWSTHLWLGNRNRSNPNSTTKGKGKGHLHTSYVELDSEPTKDNHAVRKADLDAATRLKIKSTEYVGEDENGGNVYKLTFSDDTELELTAPRGNFEVVRLI